MAVPIKFDRRSPKPLTGAEGARYSDAWNVIQARFVDDPKRAVTEADLMVRELLGSCGYPMDEFEKRPGHTSLDHPTVVTTYIAAQALTARRTRSDADTEVLRKAFLYYRILFNELLPKVGKGGREAKGGAGARLDGALVGTHTFPVRPRA